MMFKNIILSSTLGLLAIITYVPQSYSQDFTPSISGDIWFEFENDWAFDSEDSDLDVNTAYITIEPYIVLALTERLALETLLVFEEVQYPDPNEDTVFDNNGLFFEQLILSFTGDDYSIFGGKYAPTFGTAWDLAPGVFGYYFAEDYEIKEKIGGGASFSFSSEKTGEHTITANAFFADTTALSESVITKHGNLDESDGGVGNTENLSSYSVTLDSKNIFSIEGLNTHFGYINQSEGNADAGLNNEAGYVVGTNYTLPVSNNIEAMALVEWVGIHDVEGSNDKTNYITTSLGLTIYDNWNFAASYTGRDMKVTDGADIDDYVYQLSGGYEFENGIYLDVGYSKLEEDEIATDYVGALLGYVFEF